MVATPAINAGTLNARASPNPSRTVQATSSAVRSGRSASDASSGAIASQASGATGRPIAYCAAAHAVTARPYLDRFHDAEVMLKAAHKDLGFDKGKVFVSLLYSQIWCDYHQARFDDAEAGACRLLGLAVERGGYLCRIDAASLLSLVALQRGDVSAAPRRLTRGAGPIGPDDEFRVPSLLLVRGWVTAAGDVDQAMDLLAPLVFAGGEERDPWPWKPGWLRMLAHLGLRAGDQKFTEEVVRLADVGGSRHPEVTSLVGMELQLRGLVNQDMTLLERGAEVLSHSPRPMVRAGAYEDLGATLLAQDSTRDGARWLDRAWEIYRSVGATGPMSEVQNTMRRAGLHREKWSAARSRPTSGWQALTQSELKVARLIGSGYTNKAASEELVVSVNTRPAPTTAPPARLAASSTALSTKPASSPSRRATVRSP